MNAEQRAKFEEWWCGHGQYTEPWTCRDVAEAAWQACLAANAIDQPPADDGEREREKQSRIKYQELAYAAMNAIDSFLGLNVRRGEGTTVESFKDNLQRMMDEIKRIRFDGTNAEFDSAEICTLLKEAHQSVCSLQCLSQWKTSEGQQHSPLCRKITAALGTREERG